MKTRICDCCKKIILEDTNYKFYIDLFSLDICEDCKKEMNNIKEEYDEEMKKINLKQKEIINNMVKRIEEKTGINLMKEIQ